MINLSEARKFAADRKKQRTAEGESRPKPKKSASKKHISPDLAKGLAMSSAPILTSGLKKLLAEGKFPDLSKMLSLDGMLGIAAQFLPPWAGDALAVGKALASGDIAGALDAVLSKYLPPELKAVYDAIKNLPGGPEEFLKWLRENPKEPQGLDGFWAARISDLVKCPGGTGAIVTGMQSVEIGGFQAARVDDEVLCNNVKSDKITHGEPTVLIGGKLASRITDQTAHGGKITTGFRTVHISRSLGQCGGCLSSAASGGADAGSAGAGAGAGGSAFVSGSGMTGPLTEGAFGGLGDIFKDAMASPLGDMMKNKLADFASKKASEAIGKALDVDKDKVVDGSNFQSRGADRAVKKDKPQKPKTDLPKNPKDIPKPQPKIDDD